MKRIRDTSRESCRKIDHQTRIRQILQVLSDGVPRSALECSQALGKNDRSYTHPRITKLVNDGMVNELPDRVWCKDTQRVVHAYQISDAGRRWLDNLEGGQDGDSVDTGL